METTDITVVVLREIRDEIKGVRQVQEQMRQEQQKTNARLESVDNRLVTLETTVTHELVEFRKEFVVVRDLLVSRRDLGQRVARVEADVADLKRRVP
jgi:Mg2+ and Co2+ transporter CorA